MKAKGKFRPGRCISCPFTSLIAGVIFLLFSEILGAQTVTYSEQFTNMVSYNSSSVQWTHWSSFIAQLTPRTYSTVTIKGSNDAIGVTVNDPVVATAIANALYSNTPGTWSSGGRTWAVGACGSGLELSASGSICSCPSPGYIVRPHIANENWGGVNTATCTGPTQTMTVEFDGNSSAPANPTSVAASANPICNSYNTQLTASGAIGTVYWYTGSCGGTQVGTGNPITVSPTSTTTYFARNFNNSQFSTGCASLTITVNQPAFVPAAFTVASLQATGSGIQWYAAASGGSPLATSTALVDGHHYYASQTVNGCESTNRLDVMATIDPTPCKPEGPLIQTFPAGATVANLVATGANIRWYDVPTGGSSLAATTLLVSGNTYYATQTISCTQSASRFESLVLSVGDNYGGGIVAYLLQPGDPGYSSETIHGLIAATNDQSSGIDWGCFNILIPGADGIILGTGFQNSVDITGNCQQAEFAAKLCRNYSGGGFSDWYLPSKDELNKLYQNKTAIGCSDGYWSSSEIDNSYAWAQNFNTGVQLSTVLKANGFYKVRAIRSF